MKTTTLFAFSAFVAGALTIAAGEIKDNSKDKTAIEVSSFTTLNAPVAPTTAVSPAYSAVKTSTPADNFFSSYFISSKALNFFLEDKLVSEAKDNEEPKWETFDAQLKELASQKDRDFLKEFKATLNAKYEMLSTLFINADEWDLLCLAADARKYKLIMAYVDKELFSEFKIEEIEKIIKMESGKASKSVWCQSVYIRVTINNLTEKMRSGLNILIGRINFAKELKPEAITFLVKEAKLNEEQVNRIGERRALIGSIKFYDMNKMLEKYEGSPRLEKTSETGTINSESTNDTKSATFWIVVSVSATLFVALAVFLAVKVLRTDKDENEFQV